MKIIFDQNIEYLDEYLLFNMIFIVLAIEYLLFNMIFIVLAIEYLDEYLLFNMIFIVLAIEYLDEYLLLRPKKIYVFTVTCKKNLGSVGRD